MHAPTDKAVVLAAVLGTRMRKTDSDAAVDARQSAVADTGVKALIPIDRPVLHVLAEAGYRQVCLVIGPDHHELRDYYGRQLQPQRLAISFAVQAKPRGTADAVAAAEPFVGGDDFLMVNSDNHYPLDAVRALRLAGGAAVAAFDRDAMVAGSTIPADRVVRFAAVQVGPDGNMVRVIEKPSERVLAALGPKVGLSMNCWRFTPKIFEACFAIGPSPRGEFEITDAVQYAVDELGVRFRVLPFDAAVLDLSSRADIAPVAQRLAGSEVRL
jgi:dTDP-glucose pyrophosphorylase